MRALGEHLPRTLGDKKISAIQEAQPHNGENRPRKKSKGTHSPEVVALVHRNVRILLGLPSCGGKTLYSPEDWPDYDPVLAPNGYFHDGETNAVIWRPNWENLKCSFFSNLINAAVDACLQDSSVSTMPSREQLSRRVKEYLEGISKMKKKTKEEREANWLLKTICARVNPLSTWISANFENTPLAHCHESELIQTAFKRGILKSLLLVDHTETSVHGLSITQNTTNSQDDEVLMTDSNNYDEFKVLCDLYEQERIDVSNWSLFSTFVQTVS
ncbi:hypothetical protein CNBF1670 [Cryptococcus deneoformans B-3501A]|uniref:hypothetical protein n=1 Tax=Cryptococcus deneoformans (strain B-3501A) TaxID=283643 RepID=UPI000042EF86|nr:hypothetical protein CNBF1670 [Cryptococcus neoformans var. neoformans B-3501A]EAL20357.1 hypothetical protein CNBF1670 [Cryptococcus neoformans var. neoformans B-3501A]